MVVGGEFVLGGGPREDFLFNQVQSSWILLKLTGRIFHTRNKYYYKYKKRRRGGKAASMKGSDMEVDR